MSLSRELPPGGPITTAITRSAEPSQQMALASRHWEVVSMWACSQRNRLLM